MMQLVRRPAIATLFVAILLIPNVAMEAGANHATQDDLSVPDQDHPIDPVSINPTIDQKYEDLHELRKRQLELLNQELKRRNLSAPSDPPAVAARVFEDAMDPGTRVGGIGEWASLEGHWRIAATLGNDDSAAWTMTDDETGRYTAMDDILVTPALDLSAYLLQTGRLPFVAASDGSLGGIHRLVFQACIQNTEPLRTQNIIDLRAICDDVRRFNSIDARVFQDQIHLVFHHRYNFAPDADGGQVVLFTRDPRLDDPAWIVLKPHFTSTPYADSVMALDGDEGYTGHAQSDLAVFDLTPWAGKTVWIGFRAATVARAGIEPTYLEANADPSSPYGWIVDDIKVTAPAHASNLKVVSVAGPPYRLDDKDPYDRLPVGREVTFEATILHAGASTQEAEAVMRVEGLANGTAEFRFNQTLRPGEVWRPNVTVRTPDAQDSLMRVEVRTWNAGVAGRQASDPTPDDNVKSKTFVASDVRRVSIGVEPSAFTVDDHAPMTANVTVANTGNVPIGATVALVERTSAGNVTHPEHHVVLSPRESTVLTIPVTTAIRGAHHLTATATVPGVALASAETTYYVHASPPPIYQSVDMLDWEPVRVDRPIPDGGMWYTQDGTLRALPRQEIISSGMEFEDLRLTMRYTGSYLSYELPTVSIVYSTPASTGPVWSETLPTQPEGSHLIIRSSNASWMTADLRVDPREADGYYDTWRMGGLEVRVSGVKFHLDDLRLTGVPVGQDASRRMELVRINGSETLSAEIDPTKTSGMVAPLQPSICSIVSSNCWIHVSEADARKASFDRIRWARAIDQKVNGLPAAWHFGDSQAPPQRLVSPVLEFRQASDPVLSFEHAYYFSSMPNDGPVNRLHSIYQIGFVEMQYLRPDGNWSNFFWLEPEGGYPHVLAEAPGNVTREATANTVEGHLGYYHPPPKSLAPHGGYTLNRDLENRQIWTQYLPSPVEERAVFRLKDALPVDLANADVRIAFHTTSGSSSLGTSWALRNVRVTPNDAFAVDGRLDDIRIEVPYDWERIGVGPGTIVPVNVTGRNVGLYGAAFEVTLRVRDVDGNTVFEEPTTLGHLDPDRSASVLIDWSVPALVATTPYVLEAWIAPVDEIDENPFDDVKRIGVQEDLFSRAHVDVAVEVQAYPSEGREGLARYVPIMVHNLGNVPVPDVEIVRGVERATAFGRSLIEQQVWRLDAPLAPTAEPIPMTTLSVTPSVRPTDLFFTPTLAGDYFAVAQVRLPASFVDSHPANNFQAAMIQAKSALFYEDFDEMPPWQPSHPHLWDIGPGFQSTRGLQLAEPETGQIPPGTDTWIMTEEINLAKMQSGYVNMFTRYDLERGYDGARLEISTDRETWTPLKPSGPGVRVAEYPGLLVGSNPLVADPAEKSHALTGSSREAPVHLDGWVPLSFDLMQVEGMTELVVLRKMDLPAEALAGPLSWTSNAAHAPWMVLDLVDPAQRWDVHNQTGICPRLGCPGQAETAAEEPAEFWWSGYASINVNLQKARLEQRFNLSTMEEVATADGSFRLTWWEFRPGAASNGGEGVGGTAKLEVRHPQNGTTPAQTLNHAIHLLERQGDWQHVRADIQRVNVSRDLNVSFQFESQHVSGDNAGWALDDIRLDIVASEGGREHVVMPLELGEETAEGFRRVVQVLPRGSGWDVFPVFHSGGVVEPVWRWQPDEVHRRVNSTTLGSVSSRVVTPVVDLREAGSRAIANLQHSYDLRWEEDKATPGGHWRDGKHYQGGVVEIQVFNRTTGTWDDWRQIFAEGSVPTHASPPPLRGSLTEGLPYTRTLVDSGDPFARFERHVENLVSDYVHPRDAYISFAFSGRQAEPIASQFDISDYVGERVRFSFHAWAAPSDTQPTGRYWQIDGFEIATTVLSSDPAWFRLRMGSDSSSLDGSWQIDQFEVTGHQYTKSIAFVMETMPDRTSDLAPAVIRGSLRNHGPDDRHLVAIGVRLANSHASKPDVSVPNSPKIEATDEYLTILGPFMLRSAGTAGSTQPFEFELWGRGVEESFDVVLEVLEGTAAASTVRYKVADDNVPGRAVREWTIHARSYAEASLDATRPMPPAPAPDEAVHIESTIVNEGGIPINAQLQVAWKTRESGQEVARAVSPEMRLDPDQAGVFATTPVSLPPGNYTASVEAIHAGTAVSEPDIVHLRVARDDVIHNTSFEMGWEGWTTEDRFRLTTDRAHSGSQSVLFGFNNSEYIDKLMRIQANDPPAARTGSLQSPLFDLRAAGENPTLSFWHQPMFGPSGKVLVEVVPWVDGAPACDKWTLLATLSGRQTTWMPAALSLEGPSCDDQRIEEAQLVSVRFSVMQADQQGWRLDSVTVASGNLQVDPARLHFPISDSVGKEYPFVIRNPGLAPKTIDVTVDASLSRLSASQVAWMRVEPGRVTLDPGESEVVTLRVDTPEARGMFPQSLRVAVRAVDSVAPHVPIIGHLDLDFRPLARPDLAVTAAVSGRQAGAARIQVEEAIPHEMTIVVKNEGFAASTPTRILMYVVDDATGNVAWEYAEDLPAIPRYVEDGEAHIVSVAWRPPFGHRGNHTLHVNVDPDRKIIDHDRRNNALKIPIEVTRLVRPDLAVDASSVKVTLPDGRQVHEAVPDQLIRIGGIVRNEGIADARQVTIRILAGSSILKEEAVARLRPGEAYAIQATQFAPTESTVYRILAFTPDLELSPQNNEHSIELPVFPPELRMRTFSDDLLLEPGVRQVVEAFVENVGPYPLILDVAVEGGPRGAKVTPPVVTLAPGQQQAVEIALEPRAMDRAGQAPVVLWVRSDDGPQARLTIPTEIAARPGLGVVAYVAKGAPLALSTTFDAVNSGNVPLDIEAVLKGTDGVELWREKLPTLPAGETRFQTVKVHLPATTKPGTVHGSLELEAGGVRASAPLDLQVEPWSHASLRVSSQGIADHVLHIQYEGNAPAVRAPVVLGAPSGVSATPGVAEVRLEPGDTLQIPITVKQSSRTSSGLYHLQVGLLDSPTGQVASEDLVTLPLDLRQPRMRIHDVERPSAVVKEGDTVTYLVRVQNTGDGTAVDVPVHLFVNGVLVAREVAPEVRPGQTRDVLVTWMAKAGQHGVVIAIDPSGEGAAAHAEALLVETSLVPGAAIFRNIPGPSLLWLFALALLAGVRRRKVE